MFVSTQPAPVVAPPAPNVVVTLTAEEAKKLRRVCYFNITVADKENDSDRGRACDGRGTLLRSFLNDLGNSLKAKGVERF